MLNSAWARAYVTIVNGQPNSSYSRTLLEFIYHSVLSEWSQLVRGWGIARLGHPVDRDYRNAVYCLLKCSLMVPTGPLRCLAMISSAMFSSEFGAVSEAKAAVFVHYRVRTGLIVGLAVQ